MSKESEDSARERGCVADSDQDMIWQGGGPEALVARLIGSRLPETGLVSIDEHPDVPFERLSLAWLAARHTLLVYLTTVEAANPVADTMGRALRDIQDVLDDLGVQTVGVSTQPIAEQHDFADMELFTQRLLADPDLVLARILGLPFTVISARAEYRPVILIVHGGRIEHVIYPVDSPRLSAQEALDWLTKHATDATGEPESAAEETSEDAGQ